MKIVNDWGTSLGVSVTVCLCMCMQRGVVPLYDNSSLSSPVWFSSPFPPLYSETLSAADIDKFFPEHTHTTSPYILQ